MKKITSLIVITLTAISFTAFAENKNIDRRAEMQAKAQARFQSIDINHDGKLSFAEMQNDKQHKERFDKADLNHDGGLSQEEIKQAHQYKREQRQHRRTEIKEKMQAAREKAKRLDINQDQALTREEIGNEMPRLLENFAIIDGNNDGKITREEMKAARMAKRAERSSPPM